MPGLRGQHQRPALLLRQAVDHGFRLGVDGLLHTLALPVQGAQGLGQLLRLRRVLTQQQVRRHVGGAHASRRVDAGRQHEADLHRRDLPSGQTCLPQQGVQPDEVRAVQGGKAPGDDGAVLAGHLHHVGHRADGRQRAVAGKEGLLPVRAAQRQHQLQRHAAPGQMLEGIAAVGPAGVHHRGGFRQRFLTFVMVGDHHIHADGAGKGHLLHAGDAAVHGHQQRGAALAQSFDGLAAEAVAVLDPAGDVVYHFSPAAFQIIHHNAGGGDAVHVIVAENGDLLTVGKGLGDPLHSLVHVPHQERGMGQRCFLGQELRRRFRAVHAAAGQHAGYQIGISRIHQTRTCGAVFRRNVPGGKFHDPPPPFASFYNKVQYTKFANKGKGKNLADRVAIRRYIPYNGTEN